MKAVVLDSYDDPRLDFLRERLDASWEVTGSHHADPSLGDLLATCDAVITQYWPASMPPAPRVALIQLPGAGYDSIDFDRVPAKATVCNVFEHEIGIAEYVLLALLESQIHLARMDANLRQGHWRDGFMQGAPFHRELHRKRIGIIGHGHIAKAVIDRVAPFGTEVWVRTRTPGAAAPAVSDIAGMDDLHTMVEACDFLIVTCPLTEQTRGLVDADCLRRLGPEGVLINVARGPVVDEGALFEALRERTIRGAVIDTWYDYPDPSAALDEVHRPASAPFHTLDNIIMSSHASGWTDALFPRRFIEMAANLERLRRGEALANVLQAPGHRPPL